MSQTETPFKKEIMDWGWVISTMDSKTAEFVIQTNTPFVGEPEFEQIASMGLEIAAISSHGSNGQLRIHVRRQ